MGASNRKRPLDLGQDLLSLRLLLAGQLGEQTDLPRPALLSLSDVLGRDVESSLIHGLRPSAVRPDPLQPPLTQVKVAQLLQAVPIGLALPEPSRSELLFAGWALWSWRSLRRCRRRAEPQHERAQNHAGE